MHVWLHAYELTYVRKTHTYSHTFGHTMSHHMTLHHITPHYIHKSCWGGWAGHRLPQVYYKSFLRSLLWHLSQWVAPSASRTTTSIFGARPVFHPSCLISLPGQTHKSLNQHGICKTTSGWTMKVALPWVIWDSGLLVFNLLIYFCDENFPALVLFCIMWKIFATYLVECLLFINLIFFMIETVHWLCLSLKCKYNSEIDTMSLRKGHHVILLADEVMPCWAQNYRESFSLLMFPLLALLECSNLLFKPIGKIFLLYQVHIKEEAVSL